MLRVAQEVEAILGPSTVFYDDWYTHWIAGQDADLLLQRIYGKKSELVVVCVSGAYGDSAWTHAEHRAVRARLMRAATAEGRHQVLPVRVGDGEVDGVLFNEIVPDIRDKTPEETAELIVARLNLVRRHSGPPPDPPVNGRSREPVAPGLGELLFRTRIERPAGPLIAGFGADDTLVVAEKNAAVHRWSLKDRTGLTGMSPGQPLRNGINVVASSAEPAIAIARDRKLVLVHFGRAGYTAAEIPLGRDEVLVTASGRRFATHDRRRVVVRDFGDGSVLWQQPCPSNVATVTIDPAGTAMAMAGGPNPFAGRNTITVVTRHDGRPRELSFDNIPLFGAGCQLALSPRGDLAACASFREVVLVSTRDRQVVQRRRLGAWRQEVVPALGTRLQRLICTPGGEVLWLRGRRIAQVNWSGTALHYLPHDGGCDDVAFDHAGSRLATVSQSGQVDVWQWTAPALAREGG